MKGDRHACISAMYGISQQFQLANSRIWVSHVFEDRGHRNKALRLKKGSTMSKLFVLISILQRVKGQRSNREKGNPSR